MSKENRGAYDGAKARFKCKEIFVSRWKDNAVLTLASSLYGVELLVTKKKDGAKQKESTFTLTLLLLCPIQQKHGWN